MQKLLARFNGLRLQHILIVGFALIAAITIVVGALITYSVINNYLEDAQDQRVARDMDLANAFYNTKLYDIASTAGRMAAGRCVEHNLPVATQSAESDVLTAIQAEPAQDVGWQDLGG